MKIFISTFLLYCGGISGSELRSLAKQNDLESTPKSYNQLPKLLDNPKNHMTAKEISFENIKKAIGAYERILLTRGKYDDFLDGDNLGHL
ncbi:MAG: hypothetical protein QM482_08230 [Sulfurospirillum sp.]